MEMKKSVEQILRTSQENSKNSFDLSFFHRFPITKRIALLSNLLKLKIIYNPWNVTVNL